MIRVDALFVDGAPITCMDELCLLWEGLAAKGALVLM